MTGWHVPQPTPDSPCSGHRWQPVRQMPRRCWPNQLRSSRKTGRPEPSPPEPSDRPLGPGGASDPYSLPVLPPLPRQPLPSTLAHFIIVPFGLFNSEVLNNRSDSGGQVPPSSPLTTASNLPRECNSNTHNLSSARDSGQRHGNVDDRANFHVSFSLRMNCCKA